MIEWDEKVLREIDKESPIIDEIRKASFAGKLAGKNDPWQGTFIGNGRVQRPKSKKYRKIQVRNQIDGTNVLIVLQITQTDDISVLFSVNGKLKTDSKRFREIANVIDEAKKIFREIVK